MRPENKLSLILHALLAAVAIAKLNLFVIAVLKVQGKKIHVHRENKSGSEHMYAVIIVGLAVDVTSCGTAWSDKAYLYIIDW